MGSSEELRLLVLARDDDVFLGREGRDAIRVWEESAYTR